MGGVERDGERDCSQEQSEHYKQRRRTVFNVVETILGTTAARIEHLLDKDAALVITKASAGLCLKLLLL